MYGSFRKNISYDVCIWFLFLLRLIWSVINFTSTLPFPQILYRQLLLLKEYDDVHAKAFSKSFKTGCYWIYITLHYFQGRIIKINNNYSHFLGNYTAFYCYYGTFVLTKQRKNRKSYFVWQKVIFWRFILLLKSIKQPSVKNRNHYNRNLY